MESGTFINLTLSKCNQIFNLKNLSAWRSLNEFDKFFCQSGSRYMNSHICDAGANLYFDTTPIEAVIYPNITPSLRKCVCFLGMYGPDMMTQQKKVVGIKDISTEMRDKFCVSQYLLKTGQQPSFSASSLSPCILFSHTAQDLCSYFGKQNHSAQSVTVCF